MLEMTQRIETGAQETSPEIQKPRPPRLWPAAGLVAIYWLFQFISGRIELTMFEKFGVRMLASAVVLLLFLVWWLTLRRVSWTHKFLVLAAVVLGEFVTGKLAHPSLAGFFWVIVTVPVVLTVWTGWWLIARGRPAGLRDVGVVGVSLATLAVFAMLRSEGLSGEQDLNLRWRWSPTTEEKLAANRPQLMTTSAPQSTPLVLEAGDWPGFRGPERDGVVRGAKIETDWVKHPPRLVWKHPVGPAWSSMAVVGNRLFTQEQFRDTELVSCYEAGTGDAIWVHQDQVRYMDTMSGPGPRATPTFAGGQIFAFGGSGILNSLDAASGKLLWSRNVATEAGATVPMWGYASSPLVTGGMVIVYGGGKEKGLLAYHADSGIPAWSVPAGPSSYSSAQLASVGGVEQVLFLHEDGLLSVDLASGTVLWKYDLPGKGAPRTVQPRVIAKDQVLIASETDLGTGLLEVSDTNNQWEVRRRWASRALKPSFNDLVVKDGFAYGFDGPVFCCIELKSGQRQWKQGRFGHGQVLLLADQGLLLVTTEEGELVMLEAKPDTYHELARIPAVIGKTWNHPAFAHGRVYVRSDQEMVCYELAGER
jgi:outer membrane protein assembly factor BamB